MPFHDLHRAAAGFAILTALAGPSLAAEPPRARLLGYVNPQYGLSTGPLDESLLELNGQVGYRLRADSHASLLAVVRTQMKHDDRDAIHPWNDFRETTVGLQMRVRDVFTGGVDAGYHAPNGGSGRAETFFRLYAGHWQRRPFKPLTWSRAGPLTPVVTHSSSVSFKTNERSVVAAGGGDVALRVLDWDRHLTLSPLVELRVSADTAGLAWYRYADTGAALEVSSTVPAVPAYVRAGVVRRTAFGAGGTHGTFVRVVVGIWKSF